MNGQVQVLLADDHAVVREGYRRLLERTPDIKVVAETGTGEDAYRLFCELAPDVVVMDINLPGMSGFDATRRMREWPETRNIPVIGLSAAAMPRDRKRAEEAGLYRYLTKPVDVNALVAALEEVLVPTERAGAKEPR